MSTTSTRSATAWHVIGKPIPSGPGDHKVTSRHLRSKHAWNTQILPCSCHYPCRLHSGDPSVISGPLLWQCIAMQTSIFATAIRPLTWEMLCIIDPLLSMCCAKPLCRESTHNKHYYGLSSSVAFVFRVLFERIQAPNHPVSDITAIVRSLQIPLS